MPGKHPPRTASPVPLAYSVYDFVGLLATLLALPILPFLALSRHGKGLRERLGFVPAAVTRLDQPIWIHAASVGETLAAEPLVRELRRLRPGLKILVSTTSLTGQATAADRLAADAVMLLPADIVWIVNKVMRRIRPRGLVIVETELWPALLRAARQSGVPAVIVSGRITARSARHYARLGWLTRTMLQQASAYLMQSAADAQRILSLGAPADRVEVIGSLKFARDAGTPTPGEQIGAPSSAAGERQVLVAASTHAPEENVVLEACRQLWTSYPGMLVVLAPRRPERFTDVASLIQQTGLRFERWTELQGEIRPETQVLLLDTVGKLLDFMPAARAVFVGGTIAAHVGGHNVLEPAIFGKPAAFGEHTDNVAGPARALLDAGAATLVTSSAELAAEWNRLLADAQQAAAMGERGREVVAAQADVARRTAEHVCRIINCGETDANRSASSNH